MRKTIYNVTLYAALMLAALTIIAVPLQANAQESDGYIIMTSLPGSKNIQQGAPASELTLQEFIREIYLFALGIVGLVAVVAIVFWAFMYILAAGNPSKMSDAKGGIMDAILGLVLLLLAATILGFINPSLTQLRLFDYLEEIPEAEK